eukprot:s287_g32.t1
MDWFHLHGLGLDLGDLHHSLGRGAGAPWALRWRAPRGRAVGGGGAAEVVAAVAVAAVLVAVRGLGRESRQDVRLDLLHALLHLRLQGLVALLFGHDFAPGELLGFFDDAQLSEEHDDQQSHRNFNLTSQGKGLRKCILQW